jgi:hypothetical protein
MPPDTVKVDRTTRWGNPYKLTDYPTLMPQEERRRHSIASFWKLLNGQVEDPLYSLPFTAEDVRRELRGKNLACWCRDGLPCHADVLLAVANDDGAMRERAGRGDA